MRLFQITDFKLEKPLTLLHAHNQSAADMFIMSFVRSMRNLPDATYEVSEVPFTALAHDQKLFNLAVGPKPGFVWPSVKRGWELFAAYDEW
jgi:hypothetical protein